MTYLPVIDTVSVCRNDDVPALDSGLCRRTLVKHVRYHQAWLFAAQPQCLARDGIGVVDHHARIGLDEFTVLHHHIDHPTGRAERYQQANVFTGAITRTDPDDPAGGTDGGAATVAGIDGGIGLQEILTIRDSNSAMFGADDPGRDRVVQAERVAAHVAHLTLGAGIGEVFRLKDASGYMDVYSRVVTGFHNAWIAWAYIAAMLLLAIHLKHSVRAVFQTLGFSRENHFEFFEFLSWMVALAVTGGFISIPLSVQLGWLTLP